MNEKQLILECFYQLIQFMGHKDWCDTFPQNQMTYGPHPCDCGFGAAMTRIEDLRKVIGDSP